MRESYYLFLFCTVLFGPSASTQKKFQSMVSPENIRAARDKGKNDYDFTPEEVSHWNEMKYTQAAQYGDGAVRDGD